MFQELGDVGENRIKRVAVSHVRTLADRVGADQGRGHATAALKDGRLVEPPWMQPVAIWSEW
jgi:hypothetical protein